MIIADTGFWLALFDGKDQFHDAARQALLSVREGLVTTWPVLTETCYLLQRQVGQAQAATFIERQTLGTFSLFALETHHLPRLTALMRQYANLPMDLADASLVVLAEHLGHGRILSTDQRDFDIYRWKNHHPFTNLLLMH